MGISMLLQSGLRNVVFFLKITGNGAQLDPVKCELRDSRD